MNDVETPEKQVQVIPVRRPFILGLLVVFSLTYYFIVCVLFITSIFFSGTITKVINSYIPEKITSSRTILLLFSGEFILHAIGCISLILIWQMKRKGFYIFALNTFLITALHLLLPGISPYNTLFYISFVFIFGIFVKKLT